MPTLPSDWTLNLSLLPDATRNRGPAKVEAGSISAAAMGPVVPTPTLPPTMFKVLAVALALTTNALLAPARNPLAIEREPEKDDDPVPEKVLVPYVKKLPDTEATPPNEAVPLVSMSPEMSKS